MELNNLLLKDNLKEAIYKKVAKGYNKNKLISYLLLITNLDIIDVLIDNKNNNLNVLIFCSDVLITYDYTYKFSRANNKRDTFTSIY